MLRYKTILLVVVAAALTIGVIVWLRHRPEPEAVMSLAEAQREVERLKERVAVPVDAATRKKIEGLINELARDRDYTVEVNGRKYSRAWKAGGDLLRMGKSAVPQLIDAAANHPDPKVRQHALVYLRSAGGLGSVR